MPKAVHDEPVIDSFIADAIRENERARMIAVLTDNLERGAFDRVKLSNFNRGMRYAIKLLRTEP